MVLVKHVRKSKLLLVVVVAVGLYVAALFFFYLDIDPNFKSEDVTTTSLRSGDGSVEGSKNKKKTKKSLFSSLFKKKRKHRNSISGGDSSSSTSSSSLAKNKRLTSFLSKRFTPKDSFSIISSFNKLWNEKINSPWQHWSGIGFCRNNTSLLDTIPSSICERYSCFYSNIVSRPIDIDKLRVFSNNNQLSIPSTSSSTSLSKKVYQEQMKKFNQLLDEITWRGDTIECRQPSGGQMSPSDVFAVPFSKKERGKSEIDNIETTFVISLNSSDPYNVFAADSIVEVFRTASEATTAEYLITYDSMVSTNEEVNTHRTSMFNLGLFGQTNDRPKRMVGPHMVYDNKAAIQLMNNLKELFGISVNFIPVGESSFVTVTDPNEKLPDFLSSVKPLAKGEMVAFIRYDVLVLHGWLTMMKKSLKSFPSDDKVGMVGPLYLDSGGNILEAGGIVYRTGHAHYVGFGFEPRELPMQHARVVDFVSTGCVLMKKELLHQLPPLSIISPLMSKDAKMINSDRGAVDAYLGLYIYEELSYKVLFQPFSSVVHTNIDSHRPLKIKLEKPKRIKYLKGKSSINEQDELRINEFQEKHYQLLLKLHGKLSSHCPVPVIKDDSLMSMGMVRAAVGLDSPEYSLTWRMESDMGASFYRHQNRILILEDVVPETDRDAGSIRLFELLHILSELGYSVTFEQQPITGRNIRYVMPLLSDGVNMVMPGTLHDMAKSMDVASSTSSVSMKIMSQTSICPWKALIIARRDVFLRHYEDVQRICPNVPIIFDTVDVHFIRELRMFSLKYNDSQHSMMSLIESNSEAQRDMANLLANQQKELDAMKKSKVTIVVSSEEKRILHKIFNEGNRERLPPDSPFTPVDVRIISNIYQIDDSEGVVGPEKRKGAVFAGNMCHTPNMDAVDFIVREVLKTPDVFPKDFKMHFVWSRSKMCPNAILDNAMKHPLVEIHRDISNDELFALHREVKAVLAPLRYGAGVKGKVNYGLLHGVPVIATKVASEGMGLINGTNFLLAETGDDFVDSILKLYRDNDLYARLVSGGKEVMKRVFGRDVAKDRIKRAMADIGATPSDALSNGHCPFVGLHDSHIVSNWDNYWYHNQEIDQCDHIPFFPLYPRVPYTNQAYLNHVD